MVFAQSIGPLDFWGKQTVREFCKGLTAATVRDRRSLEIFAPLVPAIEVERTADPVFLYEPPEAPVDLSTAGLDDESDPLVLVCARKTAHQNEGVIAIAAAVDRLAERHGARVAFVPFAGRPMRTPSTEIIRKCRSKPMLVALDGLDASPRRSPARNSSVGVRLHALILAARFGTPFLAVPYDPKVAALTDDLDYPLPALWTPGERGVTSRVEACGRRRMGPPERTPCPTRDRVVCGSGLSRAGTSRFSPR